MKVKLLIISLLVCMFASAQQIPGYTDINSRYRWLAGVFRALHLPSGDGPALTANQYAASGAIFLDTTDGATPAGLYLYINGVWRLQGAPASDNSTKLLSGGQVIYSGTGLKFYIRPAIYQIEGVPYGTLYDSVTLSAADGTNPRKDVIYLATTGVEVATGVPAGPAAEPQLDADQIKLTVIDVPQTATTPGISTVIIYDENTEYVVTNTGTTTNPNQAATVYRLTKALEVTNINNGDIIYFNGSIPINLDDYKSIQGFIKLKAGMSGAASLRLRFFNGATVVSNEVTIAINKNTTEWQGFSVPLSDFNFTGNTYADRVNIRYINSAAPSTAHAGFFLDYFSYVSGFSQPTGGGGTPMVMGDFDSQPSSAKGSTINNNTFSNQPVTSTNPGMMLPAQKVKLDSMSSDYFITNLDNTYDTLATNVNDSTVGIKSLKDSTGIGIIDRGDYLAIYATGGGGTNNANAGAFYRWLKPTSQEIKTAAAGYGILIDSTSNTDALTFKADTTSSNGLVSKDRLTAEIAANTPNLIVQPLPATLTPSVDIVVPRNDSLLHRLINSGIAYILVDTLSDGSARIRLDTASSTLKAYIAANAGGGATPTLQQVLDAGSTLTSSETVTLNGNALAINGTSTTATFNPGTAALALTNSNNAGISVSTTYTGTGNFFSRNASSDAPPVASFKNTTSGTNTAARILSLGRASTGTPTDGLAGEIAFSLETAGSGAAEDILSNKIISRFSTVNNDTRVSELDILGVDNANEETFMNIQKDLVRINDNADTLATKAYARSLAAGGGYTDADARAAISLTTTGTSGAATYSSSTGVLNIPIYESGTWNGLFLQTLQTASTSVTLSTHGLYTYVGTADATFTLPALSSNLNRMYFIKNSSAFNVTVDRAGSDNLFTTSSVTSITIPAGSARMIGGTTASGTSYWHVMDLSEGSGGSGNVTKVGTPSNHQLAIWTGDGTIKGNTLTGSRAVVTDSDGEPVASTTTAAEIGHVNGVTSAIQTQIDGKESKSTGLTQAADYTLTSTTSLQKLFNAGGTGEINVAANTTYLFEVVFNVTSMSATSGNLGFDIVGAGTATVTSAAWFAVGKDATSFTVAAAMSGIYSLSTAETGNIVTAAAGTGVQVRISGEIRINAAGTLIPSVNLTTAAAAVVETDSYIKLTPVGNGSITNW